MGTYLSTPVTEKHQESGESLHCPSTPLAWGVVDMQGWRKSMEDSHVAQTDINVPAHHFCKDDHNNNDQDDDDDTGQAQEINQLVDGKVFGVFDGHGGPEVARFCQLYLVSALTQQPTWQDASSTQTNATTEDDDNETKDPAASDIGQALISAFHALDRMIDHPNRRDELIRLRAIKLIPGERKVADNIPPPPPPLLNIVAATDDAAAAANKPATNALLDVELVPNAATEESTETPEEDATVTTESTNESAAPANDNNDDDDNEDADAENKVNDSDSDEVVGIEEAVERDQDLMNDESDLEEEDADEAVPASSTAEKMTEMFQRLLSISGQAAGQVVMQVESGSSSSSSESSTTITGGGNDITEIGQHASRTVVTQRPPQPLPSMLANGRLMCNLPDHPIHAGATAIVAVIVGKTLTVANAGDSRAVLCRDGGAFALSYDHKPQSEIERSRIQKAGGFVNQVGRVNGNLNLSRSIGDLKYKQVEGITKAEQMITAQPDILQTKLEPTDEFIILGCDGIWDCLSNEAAVDYVRIRIGSKTPTEIGIEMLNDIMSEDPRVTQGIGGDNMTIMIIDLQPQSRSYRVADASPTEERSATV